MIFLIPPMPTPPCPYLYGDPAEFERLQAAYEIDRIAWQREFDFGMALDSIVVLSVGLAALAAAVVGPLLVVAMIRVLAQ